MMGESNDGMAVVDTNTKVFGTDNLFVVDASIHADLVSLPVAWRPYLNLYATATIRLITISCIVVRP